MDPESQKVFDSLVRKQPHELSESDIAFLKARSFYLTAEHKKIFGDVLGLEDAEEPETSGKAGKK